jgi:Glycogen recognition site of AMP-activated protein kinase
MTKPEYCPSPPRRAENERKTQESEEFLLLERMLRRMPDQEPPPDLAGRILESLAPKRISAWRRLYLWLHTPRHLSISPMKLIPAAAAVAALVVAVATIIAPRQPVLRGAKQETVKLVPVVFTLESPGAHTVSLIGSFNEWSPAGFEMRPMEEGRLWLLKIQLPEGRYRYAFLVDGRLVVADPRAPFVESDGFGNRNSIIFVGGDDEREV